MFEIKVGGGQHQSSTKTAVLKPPKTTLKKKEGANIENQFQTFICVVGGGGERVHFFRLPCNCFSFHFSGWGWTGGGGGGRGGGGDCLQNKFFTPLFTALLVLSQNVVGRALEILK